MKVLEVLDQLAETPSTNDKLVLLYENASVSGLKDTFRLAYSTQIRFWIKKRPEASQFENGKRIDLSLALQLLEENIASRKMTGNLAIEYVGGLLALLGDDDKEVLYRVIERDLKCGTGTSLANKIWKGLIQDYPVLLCNKFNEKTEKKIDWKKGQIIQCLSGNWVLNTNKGDLTIEEIIKNIIINNEEFYVKSFNHEKNITEYHNIIDVSINKKTKNHKWFSLELENGTHTKPITGNHQVWCANKQCYIRVDDLSNGDSIFFDT